MDRVLRAACVAVVVGMAVPPALEFGVIGQPNQRASASALLVLAAAVGTYAALRRQPLGARLTTVAYGAVDLGLGLFATNRPIASLLAYVVGLIGMNVLLYHASAYGPVLAAFRDEDAIARRARGAVLRSLGISGAVLAATYAGSLALLPAFALDFGARDSVSALAVAAAVVTVLLFLAMLPAVPFARPARSRSPLPR